jgi:hypothetical protein
VQELKINRTQKKYLRLMPFFLSIVAIVAVSLFPREKAALAQTNNDSHSGMTLLDDTRLWFVPTAAVLANRQFVPSIQRSI